MKVKPKKHLGQHFLHDVKICEQIADALRQTDTCKNVLEIGPGTGALTRFLLKKDIHLKVIEVDTESIEYLEIHYPSLKEYIINRDFLEIPLEQIFNDKFIIIGNFPYNISSQILFRVYDHRHLVPEVVGMFQKEVAERVACKPGSKTYGILSVLLQAFYDIEYLFTVHEGSFNPPPKVKSGVIRLTRNKTEKLGCNERLFFTVVKVSFNQRRKTIRNSIKSLIKQGSDHPLLIKRPEQLGVEEFIELTNFVEANALQK